MAKIVNRPFRGGSPRTLMRGKTEKAKNFKKTFKIFIKYLKPYRLKLILVLLFALAATAFTIASPKILGQMTDVIVRGLLNHNKELPSLLNLGFLFFIFYLRTFNKNKNIRNPQQIY